MVQKIVIVSTWYCQKVLTIVDAYLIGVQCHSAAAGCVACCLCVHGWEVTACSGTLCVRVARYKVCLSCPAQYVHLSTANFRFMGKIRKSDAETLQALQTACADNYLKRQLYTIVHRLQKCARNAQR